MSTIVTREAVVQCDRKGCGKQGPMAASLIVRHYEEVEHLDYCSLECARLAWTGGDDVYVPDDADDNFWIALHVHQSAGANLIDDLLGKRPA